MKFINFFLAAITASFLPTLQAQQPTTEYNVEEYQGASQDQPPRYISIRGIMCQVIWECDGLLTCQTGDSGAQAEDGKPYFSPLLWALFDLRDFSKTRNPTPPMKNVPTFKAIQKKKLGNW